MRKNARQDKFSAAHVLTSEEKEREEEEAKRKVERRNGV